MADTLDRLGKLIVGDAGRDAVHIAVAPVTAAHVLRPGDRVGFVGNMQTEVGRTDTNPIGIVDPYLREAVQVGQRFYVCLFPQTISSLRHVWSHPSFPEEVGQVVRDASVSEEWLRGFFDSHNCPDYDTMMRIIEHGDYKPDGNYSGGRVDDDYFLIRGTSAYGEIPAEFWVHAEIVLGHPLLSKPTSFTCSC